MKKILSLMLMLCMILLIVPALTAAADSAEETAREASDAAELYNQALALMNAEEYEAAFALLKELEERA